ncbi:energy transducer TonB, partial [Thermodesulfobacteriota bacterium]
MAVQIATYGATLYEALMEVLHQDVSHLYTDPQPTDLILFNTAGPVKGRVRITYTIRRSGALHKVQVVGGSGNSQLDHTLLKAIKAAQPFPPFPDGVLASRIVVRANFIVADLPT